MSQSTQVNLGRSGPGREMAREIREQPDIYRRILREGQDPVGEIARVIRQKSPRFVLLAARGTSDHAALYGKYLVETRLRLPAGLASPSTITVYDANQQMEGVLLIAISQSGSSPDIVIPTRKARSLGAITLAITNDSTSPLSSAADLRLDMLAGVEEAVAATKTYTAELLMLFLLIEALCGRDSPETASLPEKAERALELEPQVRDIAVRWSRAQLILATSRGYNLPTALEISLKLIEAARIPSFAFSGADLIHGPSAMVEPGCPVIVVIPRGPGNQAMAPVVKVLEEREADLLVVGDVEELRADHSQIPIFGLEPEYLSPLLAILPLQLLALHLGLERGFEPDSPRGLSKVTRTW